jgi:hypothetical protein
VYKSKKALEIWRKNLGDAGQHGFSFCSNVTTVWEDTNEDSCVTKGRASVGPPKSLTTPF